MDPIFVYPPFNARYYAHHVQALKSVVPPGTVKFTTRGFPRFGPNCLAIRIGSGRGRRIYIHSDDMPDLDPAGLAWCDVFGKVNLDPNRVPAGAEDKVVCMGPIFPYRFSGPVTLAAWALTTYLEGWRDSEPLRRHISLYRGLYTFRSPVENYSPRPSEKDYIFFIASIWEREPEGNAVRSRFIEACRSLPQITFEGGLSPRDSARGTQGWTAPEFEKYSARRYGTAEYLEKTKRSALALNNPAYLDGHSWRLAENMALGKAIVSTPLRRAVPEPLIHRTHIHFVDGSVESFREAALEICSNDDYRRRLERNARAYYDRYLEPSRVMQRLLEKAGYRMESVAGASARTADAVSTAQAGIQPWDPRFRGDDGPDGGDGSERDDALERG
jgi:hypothetical protein